MSRSLLPFLLLVIGFAYGQPTGKRYHLKKIATERSLFHEAAPVVSPDGNTLYSFIQDHPQNTFGKEASQDIWRRKKAEDGTWPPAEHLGPPFNQNRQNQVFNVLNDGSVLVRGGKAKNSVGFSIVSPSGAIRELDISGFQEMNKGPFYGACMTGDGKHLLLYFSDMAGRAKSDLYISHHQGGDQWSRPEKLKLSTGADEFSPFISPDQKTLFFASDRIAAGRQGAIDTYKCTRMDDNWTTFSEPLNLGKPINTSAEDYYFSMDNAGNVFTSRANSVNDGGKLTVFVLVPAPIHITLEGTVTDARDGSPLGAAIELTVKDHPTIKLTGGMKGEFRTAIAEGAEYHIRATAPDHLPFEASWPMPHMNADSTLHVDIRMDPVNRPIILQGDIRDVKTGKPLEPVLTIQQVNGNNMNPATTSGSYSLELPGTGTYVRSASLSGYLNFSDTVIIADPKVTPVKKDIAMTPIEVGAVVRLRNIYFDYDKTTLKPESFVELAKVVSFLQANPTVEIEIQGHTDSHGSDAYNLTLSQGRSQSVVDHLIGKGIAKGRLAARGFGETKPIDTNDTDSGRANNRRVEFTIIKK
ncbi:MAG: OmpA family protein [Bacteroidota bacterium]